MPNGPLGDTQRIRSSIRIQRSFEASRASRLLDVSPPHFGMSGLTSDSDYGVPVKRKDVSPFAPRLQPSDTEPDAPTLNDELDEWELSEALDSDGRASSSKSQQWTTIAHGKVGTQPLLYFGQGYLTSKIPSFL